MNRLRQILKDQRGVAFPLIVAIVLVLVMLMCCISEYFRLLIVAQGVRDAVQEAVISTVNDNYDDVYHGVREGYSGAYQPLAGVWFTKRCLTDLTGIGYGNTYRKSCGRCDIGQ